MDSLEINTNNNYLISNHVFTMQRHPANLEYSGTLVTSLHKPLKFIAVDLAFDAESHKHGLLDMHLTDSIGTRGGRGREAGNALSL